jgi:hypothetical protein
MGFLIDTNLFARWPPGSNKVDAEPTFAFKK